MSQVTGMVPGMKKEEEVPDVAPQEEQYQEYTVSTSKPWSIFMSRRMELLKVSCSRNLQLLWIFHWTYWQTFQHFNDSELASPNAGI